MKALTKMSDATDAITKMPAFNKTITIELDIDDVNKRMLDLLPGDYKHREVLSHAIIGSAVAAGNLGYICKALHGYTNDIDFEVGDEIICTEKDRVEVYDANLQSEDGLPLGHIVGSSTPDYVPFWKRRTVAIGKCKIIEINLYKDIKLKVQFEQDYGHAAGPRKEQGTEWVSHRNCTRVPKDE